MNDKCLESHLSRNTVCLHRERSCEKFIVAVTGRLGRTRKKDFFFLLFKGEGRVFVCVKRERKMGGTRWRKWTKEKGLETCVLLTDSCRRSPPTIPPLFFLSIVLRRMRHEYISTLGWKRRLGHSKSFSRCATCVFYFAAKKMSRISKSLFFSQLAKREL